MLRPPVRWGGESTGSPGIGAVPHRCISTALREDARGRLSGLLPCVERRVSPRTRGTNRDRGRSRLRLPRAADRRGEARAGASVRAVARLSRPVRIGPAERRLRRAASAPRPRAGERPEAGRTRARDGDVLRRRRARPVDGRSRCDGRLGPPDRAAPGDGGGDDCDGVPELRVHADERDAGGGEEPARGCRGSRRGDPCERLRG